MPELTPEKASKVLRSFLPPSCSFFFFPPSTRSFTSGLVLEWSKQQGQAAGRSMSEEAGTSCQALLLSCFSDIVGYALQVACIRGSQMQYSGPNLLQRRVHNGMQFLFRHLRIMCRCFTAICNNSQSPYSNLLKLRPSKFSSGANGLCVLETWPVGFWAKTPSTLNQVSRVFFSPCKQIPGTI